ncbi:ABC transporter substrate-binding protein [Archangium sp.]|uniref:ABC transporter substrate-binding protein n=1 Tax=Archangium sp. TaxID=1872627 RepID=UPI00286C21DE|nr:ABC transporter substrate-binding protein [Archangium sp.]
MRNVLKGLAIATLLTSPALVHAETVVIACGPKGDEFEQCEKGAKAWARKTGHEVRLVSGPRNTTEQLTLFQEQLKQQRLNADSPKIDVYRIDVTWPGLLAEHFIDLKPYVSEEVLQQHFPAIVRNNTVGGKLVAMPWFIDAGLLYYRKDLLEKHGQKPPTTWQELATVAKTVQEAEHKLGNKELWGFVFQAKEDEMLTCNALEWIGSFGGGTIVDEDGKVTINEPEAVEALKMAASWIETISPKAVLNYEEEDALRDFRSGKAVFMRNWTKEWVNANAKGSKVKGKVTSKGEVAVMALPKGGQDGQSIGTLGGWQLAVSRYSKHPEIAADLVKYLTSPEEQERRAIKATFSPTVMALYQDPEVLKANPFYKSLLETFTTAVARPSHVTGPHYISVSTEFFNTVHAVLSKSGKPEDKLKDLQKTLEGMSNKDKW